MSKPEHSPEPWTITPRHCKNGITYPPYVVDANGDTVCDLGAGMVHYGNSRGNADLIIRAPRLANELVRLRAKNARLREACGRALDDAVLFRANIQTYDGNDEFGYTAKTMAGQLTGLINALTAVIVESEVQS